jgi:hypothetical protein
MIQLLRIALTWTLTLSGIATALGIATLCAPRTTMADNHLIDINEVYTNADGTLQFVEMIARANLQTNLAPTHIDAANGDSSSANLVFDFTTSFPALNINETILLATSGFQAAAGFAPDFIIPNGMIFLTNGRVEFDHEPPNVFTIDAVAYGSYSGPNTGFGSPAVALPSNGFSSLTRVGLGNNNIDDFEVLPNSPTRNDGTTGQIPPPNAVESALLPPVVVDLNAAPNPFVSDTRVAFDLRNGGHARLQVFGADGRLVREVWDGVVGAGLQTVIWDRRDGAGRSVAAGVYYLRLVAGEGGTRAAKVTVLP